MDILIVEDVEAMGKLLEIVFGGISGISVSGLAKNGWEARIELSRRRPDLILLDEILPGESGADLLQQFHSYGIPVILLTGLESAAHEIPPKALGRLIKPGWRSVDRDRVRLAAELKRLLAHTALKFD